MHMVCVATSSVTITEPPVINLQMGSSPFVEMRMDQLMLPVEELHLSPIHGHQAVVIQRKQTIYSQEHIQ